MLRITAQDTPTKITLALEGNLVGVWVGEFLNAWRAAQNSLNGRELSVDLSSVGHVDKTGEYLLALVHCHGGQLAGSGLMTGHLIETIAQEWPVDGAALPQPCGPRPMAKEA
jgi:ABC-type transporter Mla MlaB component